MEQSIWELMNHGLGAMWVVFAFSVLALGVGIERVVAQWGFLTRARQLTDQVRRGLSRGAVEESRSACERSPSPLADVFLVGYEKLGRASPEHVATAVHRERLRVNQALRARLWMLGTIGATAPFVGLFGTVVGIMSAMGGFNAEQEVKFTTVSGPISAALVVTAAGIFVAVESVILFNFFSQRAGRISAEMKLLTDEFLELLVEPDRPTTAKDEKPAEPKDGKKGAAMAIGKLPDAEESETEAIFAEINITPLTDVFLVLLIIFMLSALAVQVETSHERQKITAQQDKTEEEKKSGIKINLPSGQAQEIDPTKASLVLEIPLSGDVQVGGKVIPEDRIDNMFGLAFQHDKSTQVVLKADKGVSHGRVVKLMEQAKKAGLVHLAIGTSGG